MSNQRSGMHLLVLGGTGATGRVVVGQALTGGHSVRALVRSPEKLGIVDSRLEVVTGQVTSPSDIKSAMFEVDAVISTLGSNTGTVLTEATHAIIAAREAKRLVMLSSFAVLNGQLSVPAKLMARALSAMARDKAAAEEMLRASDLDWTIVHAVRLANRPATGQSRVLPDAATLGLRLSISRADVAAWLLDTVAGDNFRRREIVLGR